MAEPIRRTRRRSDDDAGPAPDAPVSFGWRSAVGVNYADPQRPGWENPREVWSATAYGPCTKCQERCLRYGPGGNPLCPDCHPATAQARHEAA